VAGVILFFLIDNFLLDNFFNVLELRIGRVVSDIAVKKGVNVSIVLRVAIFLVGRKVALLSFFLAA